MEFTDFPVNADKLIMKNLLFLLLLVPLSLHAQTSLKQVKQWSKVLEDQQNIQFPMLECGIERMTPKIKKGEVKISYDCADFPVPDKKVDEEVISFYESDIDELIIRSRVNKKDPSQSDVTVKYRPDSSVEKIELEKVFYENLKKKADESDGSIELKCEADVTMGPKIVNSCSLTTITRDLTRDHQAFAAMSTQNPIKSKLADYKSVSVAALSWKVASPAFEKKIAFEQWKVKNKSGKELCILEVSAKFEVDENPKHDLSARLVKEAESTLKKLAGAFPKLKPSSEQGNKTGKAVEFAKSH